MGAGGIGEGLGALMEMLMFLAIWGLMTILGAIASGFIWIFIPIGPWMAYTIGGFSATGFILGLILPKTL